MKTAKRLRGSCGDGVWARGHSQWYRHVADIYPLSLSPPTRRRQWRELGGLSSPYSLSSSSSVNRSFSITQWQQIRALHATRRRENIMVGGLVVAGGALVLQYGLKVST